MHRYGPHIFHTNDARVWNYLSQFTEWRTYYHRVLGLVDGLSVSIPFNLNSLHALFPARYAEKLEEELINAFGFGVKVPILKMLENSSKEIKVLADYIYKNVFEGYTLKQWGVRPEDLGAAVTGRVPVLISRDDRYFQDIYQAMPRRGFTEMFRRILAHKNIKVLLNTDYREIINDVKFNRMVYTGPVDAFFDYRHGHLPYRSLRFEFQYDEYLQHQAVGTVNYPNEQAFTRVTEFKHLTGQCHAGTTIVREYAQPYIAGENDPYYPFPTQENQVLAAMYAEDAAKLKDTVIFAGRLADYKYYNMDQAVARALMIFEKQIAISSTT